MLLFRVFAACSSCTEDCVDLNTPLRSVSPYLNEVVEVVLPSNPAVIRLLTVRLVGDVLCVQTFAVVELPFEQLQSDRDRQRERRRLSLTHRLSYTGAFQTSNYLCENIFTQMSCQRFVYSVELT